ncbi:MAG: S8 family serine peptidase [Sutterellaceae bacterium]|nr:S8 family serine peptidase [Burkholderiaceae bacterium]MCX7901101.1 S8 family serine peptidase [Burkholderiaceae bacterium]MDW8428973.1 S8 family serine peptidase [Sutterellaceae bacterium]
MTRATLLFALAIACAGTHAQATLHAAERQAPAAAPRPGLGVQIDFGAVWRAVRALAPRVPHATHADNRLLALYELRGPPLDQQQLLQGTSLRVVADIELPQLGLRLLELQADAGTVEAVLPALRQAFPQVTFDLDALWFTQVTPTADEPVGRVYASRMLGLETPAPLARPVRVAVLDGDLDESVGLEAAVIARARFGEPEAGIEHGTAVACLLACRTRSDGQRQFFGLAQGLALLHAAVLQHGPDGHARARTAAVLRGLDWALAQGAEIVNISLASAPNAVTERAIRAALPRLSALVAAAGNGGERGPPVYPAAISGVIAVSAVDAQSRPYQDGSRGPHLVLAAPGVDLWLPRSKRTPGGYVSGTSYAAPLAAAVIAQRLARGLPGDADSMCRAALDLPPAGRDEITGCGLVQLR